MSNLIKAVKTAERCQRNWDYSIPIPDEDIKTLVEVATTMPTKQNRKFYELIVSSNPEFNKICYTHAVDPYNSHFVNREIHRNTQANAPLIMMWRTTDQTEVEASDMFKDDYMKNYYTSVGVSSGATVLTANALGYRTGYCNCINDDTLMDELEEKFDIMGKWAPHHSKQSCTAYRRTMEALHYHGGCLARRSAQSRLWAVS